MALVLVEIGRILYWANANRQYRACMRASDIEGAICLIHVDHVLSNRQFNITTYYYWYIYEGTASGRHTHAKRVRTHRTCRYYFRAIYIVDWQSETRVISRDSSKQIKYTLGLNIGGECKKIYNGQKTESTDTGVASEHRTKRAQCGEWVSYARKITRCSTGQALIVRFENYVRT